MKKVFALALCGLIVPAASFAEVFTAEAFNNLTVQPLGPRPGGNGLNFFNVQGSDNGTFASFGVAEIQPSAFGLTGTVSDFARFTVQLTQANAGFTIESGAIDVWVTEDATADFNQTTSSLFFDLNFLPAGIGNQLTPLTQVGTLQFEPSFGSGFTYNVDLTTIPAPLKTYLIGQINGDLPIRLVFTPGNTAVDGSFAGYSNNTYAGPTVEIDAVLAGGANQTLSGTLNLSDTVFGGPYTRTITGTVKQGAVTVGTITVNANSSSTAFSGDIPASATGAATIEWDGSSFLLRKANVTLTGASLALGTITLQNGDVDGSGEVDAADIDEVIANFGSDQDINADLDVSGEVDAADIDIAIANFGGSDD